MKKITIPDLWDTRFLALAEHISTWSKDPSTQVGAVIVDASKRVVSMGFNGFPRGIADNERLHDRSIKYEIILHAEVNAVLFARANLEGCTLYIWPCGACSRCASLIIQSGITRVVMPSTIHPRFKESIDLGIALLREAGVDVTMCE